MDNVQDAAVVPTTGAEPVVEQGPLVQTAAAEPCVEQGLRVQTAAEPRVEQGPGVQTAAEPAVEQGPVQTGAEPGVEQGLRVQTAAEPGVEQASKDVHMVSEDTQGFRSLDSMTTFSWGRRFSMESLVADTPWKQPPQFLELQIMELQSKLFDAFGNGTTSDDEAGRQKLGDLIMDWVMDLQSNEFPPMQGTDAMCIRAQGVLEAWTGLKDLSKHQAYVEDQLKTKMMQADQAVAKALQTVIQHAGSANSVSSSTAVTQKMAAWKQGLLAQGMKEIDVAKAKVQTGIQQLEESTMQLIKTAFGIWDSQRPKSEEEILAVMMQEVEDHMSALQLSEQDPRSGAGTGGTDMHADPPQPSAPAAPHHEAGVRVPFIIGLLARSHII